jgi:hypothetical protein
MTKAATAPTFLETREYQRFTEFADAVRRDRYIGLCYGPPGVGKTLSARHYSHWDAAEDYFVRMQRPALERFTYRPPAELATVRCVCWTAPVLVTASHINRGLVGWCRAVDTAIRRIPGVRWRPQSAGAFPHVELVLVDEADRLKTAGLEQLRDLYDRHPIGLVLIGMPGLQRRLTRYPQLYSRSDSPTNTGHLANANSWTCCPVTPPNSACSSPKEHSATPARRPRSPASPPATLASCTASSPRSTASPPSTTSPPSLRTS